MKPYRPMLLDCDDRALNLDVIVLRAKPDGSFHRYGGFHDENHARSFIQSQGWDKDAFLAWMERKPLIAPERKEQSNA